MERNIVQGMVTGILGAAGATVTGVLTKDSCFFSGSAVGVSPGAGTGWVVINNDIIRCSSGISNVNAAPSNALIGFNSLVQNTAGNISLQGTNTFLGNFAFNTNAVGSPAPTNYTVGTSNITGKFITASQRGSFIGVPAYWHNINMLP